MTANFEFPGFGSIGAIGKCCEFEQVASVFAEKSASRSSRCSVCWATAVRCAIRDAWASAIPKAALDRFDSLAQWSRIGWWYTIASNYHFKWVILWRKNMKRCLSFEARDVQSKSVRTLFYPGSMCTLRTSSDNWLTLRKSHAILS